MIKLCLLSLGLILGIYFKSYLTDLLWLWWAIFAVTTAYFIGKMVQESDMSRKSQSQETPAEAKRAQRIPDVASQTSSEHDSSDHIEGK